MRALLKKIMNKCNILMFAAGLGTRLRPATLKHPKPAIPLNKIPLGYYALPYLEKIKAQKFVINTFHLPEQIHQLYLATQSQLYSPAYSPAESFEKNDSINSKKFSEIIFSDETDFIKGSGGGLKQAEKYFDLNLPILTMNADEIFFTPETDFIKNALAQHQMQNAMATLIVTEHPEAGHTFGAIWCEPNPESSTTSIKVIHIGKNKPTPTAKPWHFIGLQILSPKVLVDVLKNTESNIFYDVLIHQLQMNKIQIYPIKCDWYEVGNLEDYKKAKSEINQKLKTDLIYQTHYQKLNQFKKSQLSDLA